MKFIIILILTGLSTYSFAQNFNQTNSEGQKIGKWQKEYDNGKIKYQGQFENGYEIGTFTYYFPEGNIQRILKFSEKGKKAQFTSFYKSQVIEAKGFYYEQQKDSIWQYYSEKPNTISKEESYNKGKKDGVWKVFYPNGKIDTEERWKNDVRDGNWKEYFDNGNIKLLSKLKEGKLDSTYTTYYIDGKISQQGKYVNGKADGIWTTYNEKGEYLYIEKYKMGTLDLTKKYENGVLSIEIDNINNTVKDYRKKEEPQQENGKE